jgi:RNA-binding protein 39
MPFTANRSPPPNAKDMTPEERDERTVFILQLARNTRPTDLEDFFSSVGHVRDVRIITDSKTRRSKGIAYVEFWEKEAIPLALGLAGQRLCGAPIIIQQTCAERNRAAAATVGGAIGFGPSTTGPLKLCVQQLHSNITDEMLSAIFEPFGRIESCEVAMQPPGVSKGFGYVVFRNAEEGKRAMEQLNGFELAGKNIRIITVDEEEHRAAHAAASHRLDEGERAHLGTNGRLQLMAKLAQGSGMELPKNATDALVHQQTQQQQYAEGVSPIATQCFMLSNMFDPAQETEPGWELDVRDDVIDECNNHGGIVHIYIDMASPEGNVYVKCPTVAAADRSVGALHGRWFSGKVITANYVPVISYHELFPDSMHATHLLKSRDRT